MTQLNHVFFLSLNFIMLSGAGGELQLFIYLPGHLGRKGFIEMLP